MKWSSAILAVFVLASSPASALNVGTKPDCPALLDKLATCNQQPDTARLECQQGICTSYAGCLAGPPPMTPIPQLSKLCSGLAVAAIPSSQAATPIQVTAVR